MLCLENVFEITNIAFERECSPQTRADGWGGALRPSIFTQAARVVSHLGKRNVASLPLQIMQIVIFLKHFELLQVIFKVKLLVIATWQ